jgi:sugar lactone lactonase YvrE
VFAAEASAPTRWSRLGQGLPNASTNDLTIAPNGAIVAATHGRGIWTFKP